MPKSHSPWVAKVELKPAPSSSKTHSPAQQNPTLLNSPGLGSFTCCKETTSIPGRRLPLPVDERDHSGKDLLVQARGHALHTLYAGHLEPCSAEERRVGILRSGPCLEPGTSLLALENLAPHTHITLLLKLLVSLGSSSSVLSGPPGSCVTLPLLHCDLLVIPQGSTQCHLLREACCNHCHEPIRPILRTILPF